jgi:Methyltransferase domain
MIKKLPKQSHRELVIDDDRKSIETDNTFLLDDNQAIARGFTYGLCLVCGVETLFRINHPNLRETLSCSNCLSYNRQRQLVYVMCKVLGTKTTSLKELIKSRPKGEKWLLLESVTNLAESIKYYSNLFGNITIVDSEYLSDDMRSGERDEQGRLHIDIHDTGFKDNEFELIIHADVFEHVADAPSSEAEQLRILTNTGSIVYTAPFIAELESDDVRAVIENGNLKHLADPIYHGDPSPRADISTENGILVFRIFSYQGIKSRAASSKAKFNCHYLHLSKYGILGNNGFVFQISKK